MANEVRIKLTDAQRSKIKSAIGKDMTEIRVSNLGKGPAAKVATARAGARALSGRTVARSVTGRNAMRASEVVTARQARAAVPTRASRAAQEATTRAAFRSGGDDSV